MHADYLRDPLWLKLHAMDFDEPGVPVPLSARIKRETGLTDMEVSEAIAEYKKYIYIAAIHDLVPVMPERADRVWITHITYTLHYWDYMCREILGKDIHHVSKAELAERHPTDPRNAHATLDAYRSVFGTDPPRRLSSAIPDKSHNSYLSWFAFAILAALVFLTNGVATFPIGIAVVLGTILTAAIGGFSTACYRGGKPVQLSSEDRVIRDALDGMEIGRLGDTSNPLITQLEKNSGWNREKCERAIREYRRYLFVRHMADHKVTPSPDIDKVWHLHLIHSEHYWMELCGSIPRQPFHHQPASGRRGEWERFETQYRKTIATYERLFDEMPSADIWPHDPTIRQNRALWAGIGMATAIAILHLSWPIQPIWLTILGACPLSALAAATAYRWPIDDAALTRREFGKRESGHWEMTVGGCGGCGGCGG